MDDVNLTKYIRVVINILIIVRYSVKIYILIPVDQKNHPLDFKHHHVGYKTQRTKYISKTIV
jgi:hypothetical protein